MSFRLTSDSRRTASPFGVLDFLSWDHEKFSRHYTLEDVRRSAALMQEAGVGMVRFDFLWEDIEPEPGRFQFEKYDRIVEAVLERGIRVLGVLAYNPPWSKRTWNQAPDPLRYAQFVQTVANHFIDRICHWQIWHEPDSPNYWLPQDQLRSYVNLLRRVYPLLKATDPNCVVHLGGMSRSLPGSLKHLYLWGGQSLFDVISIHPFANPLLPGALDGLHSLYSAVRRVIEEHGDSDKPVWFTEVGCPGVADTAGVPHWWLGRNPDEEQQAQWVKRVYTQMLSWAGVEKIFWCFFRDTPNHFHSGSDYDGLIRRDFSIKPAFRTYQALSAAELAAPRR